MRPGPQLLILTAAGANVSTPAAAQSSTPGTGSTRKHPSLGEVGKEEGLDPNTAEAAA